MAIGEGRVGERPGIGDGVVTTQVTYRLDMFLYKGPYDGESGSRQVNYCLDMMLSGQLGEKSYDMDMLLCGDVRAIYAMDMVLISHTVNQTMDMQLILSPDARIPKRPAIAVLLDSWSYALDDVWLKTKSMAGATKIENAVGIELDEWWGELFGVKRRLSESDTDYRKRIQNYSNILKGSGTKKNIEEIVDQLLDESGTTHVRTRWPGVLDITFVTDSGGRNARLKKDLLDYVLPDTIAAGTTYQILLPFIDYNMDMALLGDIELSYTMGMRIGVPTIDYYMNMNLARNLEYTLMNLDMLLQKDFFYVQQMSLLLRTDVDLSYTFDSMLLKHDEIFYHIDSVLKKECDLPYFMDQLSLKHIECPTYMSMIVQENYNHSQYMDMVLSDTQEHVRGAGIVSNNVLTGTLAI